MSKFDSFDIIVTDENIIKKIREKYTDEFIIPTDTPSVKFHIAVTQYDSLFAYVCDISLSHTKDELLDISLKTFYVVLFVDMNKIIDICNIEILKLFDLYWEKS